MEDTKRPKAKMTEKRRSATMTFRTDKMVDSLTEVAARSQGISVSEYLERSTKESFDRVMVDRRDEGEPGTPMVISAGRPLSEIADELYDEDDVTCLFKRLRNHSWALNREQFRMLKLIHISPLLYPKVNKYNMQTIRELWKELDAVANGDAPIETLPAGLFGNADIKFALMSEAEQVAFFREYGQDEFFRRNKTHLTKAKVK